MYLFLQTVVKNHRQKSTKAAQIAEILPPPRPPPPPYTNVYCPQEHPFSLLFYMYMHDVSICSLA